MLIYFLRSLYFTILVTLTSLCLSYPAIAAETVMLKYGFLRESISVPELTTFTATGELSPSLSAYLRLANQEPEKLQQLLTKAIEVDAVLLYKILTSVPGELLLDQVSTVVHTPSDRASRQSLRAALVSSALEDDNITLIEIMENYPTSEVHIEGDRLAQTYSRISGVVEQFQDWGLWF